MGTLLADCQPAGPGDSILRIRPGDYPALAAEGGSVRLAFNRFSIKGPEGPFYPVLVNRGAGDQYYALSSRCMHQGCVVPTYDRSLGAMGCFCHGSQYELDGSVRRGPTTDPLTRYALSYSDGVLCVGIPDLSFAVTVLAVDSGGGPLLRLEFPTYPGCEYEVWIRRSPEDPGQVTPFSSTADEPPARTVWTATDASTVLFVPRLDATGFLSVALRARERQEGEA